MNKTLAIVVLAVGAVGTAAVGGILLLDSPSGTPRPAAGTADVARLENELAGARADIRELLQVVKDLQESHGLLSARVTTLARTPIAAPAVATEGEEGVEPAALQDYVAAVLDAERQVRDAEREQQREEARARMAERREEQERLSEGPWDRYNLRVNSLGSVLALNDGQKQAYFDLASAARDKLDEGMKKLREERQAKAAAEGATEEDRGRGRRGGFGRGNMEEYQELQKAVQEEFVAGLSSVFNSQQMAAFGELSNGAQSFNGRDQVYPAGEEPQGFGGRGGFATGDGNAAGFGGFGGGRGGRGGAGGGGRGGR